MAKRRVALYCRVGNATTRHCVDRGGLWIYFVQTVHQEVHLYLSFIINSDFKIFRNLYLEQLVKRIADSEILIYHPTPLVNFFLAALSIFASAL